MIGEYQGKKRLDAKTRVNASLDEMTHDMLRQLAFACNLTKTSMAAEIISIAVKTPEFVIYLQNKYKAEKHRIIPTIVGNKVVYIKSN